MNRTASHPAQRGAALLLAMLILTLVSTLAAGMVWQQWRAVQVEGAERARVQAAWILTGALDWARLILREDGRTAGADHLGEPWAVPLAEARLSSFLASEGNTTSDDGPEAFLSGLIIDVQSRYNLRNLIGSEGAIDLAQLKVLERLFASAGLSAESAKRLADGLRDAWSGANANAAVAPQNVSQLTWLGLDAAAVEKLRPWVDILPIGNTKVNLNTAPREVLAAVVEGLDLGGAERLIEVRQRNPFDKMDDAAPYLPAATGEPPIQPADRLQLNSNYFEVQGRLRLGDRVLEERSLVVRQRLTVTLLQRERISRSSANLP